MAKNSKIEWTQHTWNPWQGCHKVSPGCKHCYMFREKIRYGQEPNVVIRSKDATFNAPLKWRDPAFVFTCSWSDFFIEEADAWRDAAWQIIRQTPHLTYQILTKRPERIFQCLPNDWDFSGYHNVWLIVSIESQDETSRIDILQSPMIHARVKGISAEPLLGSLDLTPYFQLCNVGDEERDVWIEPIDWVITGGESGIGQNYRPANLDWFRQIRDDCLAYDIPFFHKQHGGNKKINGVWGGRELDGRTWNEMPQP